jgi:hypothetical protein
MKSVSFNMLFNQICYNLNCFFFFLVYDKKNVTREKAIDLNLLISKASGNALKEM